MEELNELISQWNKSHPNQLVDESDFKNKKAFKKLLNKIGVEAAIHHFPIYSDFREINDPNKHTQEFVYDCYDYRIKVIKVENSGGKYQPQTFFEI